MTEKMRLVVRKFDWNELRALLPARDAPDEAELIGKFVADLLRSSMLCVFSANPASQQCRDKFVSDFRAEVEQRGHMTLASSLGEALSREQLIERGYHAIFESVDRKLRTQLTPIRHAWAAIANMERQAYALRKNLRERFIDAKEFHIDAAWVNGEYGNLLDADEQMCRMARLVTSTLLMVGTQNNWFNESGRKQLVLPVFEQVNHADIGLGIADSVLANSYTLLRHAADNLRHFGGTVSEGTEKIPFQDGEHDVVALSVLPDMGPQQLVYVAQHRLSRMRLQHVQQFHLQSDGTIRAKFKELKASKLPPDEFVSEAEFHAVLVLSQLLCAPLIHHPIESAGLTLLEWLRGYSVIQELGRNAFDPEETVDVANTAALDEFIANILLPLEDDSLVAILRDTGLTESKAKEFIEAITLSRTHDDLMDAPLIKCGNGRRYLLPRTASLINPAMVLLSQLAHIGANLSWKGRTFEDHILQLLRDAGLKASRYDGEVEIDCVLLWNDYVFVLEDKNIALPNSAEGALFHFMMAQAEAIEQAREKLEWLKNRPNVLQELFGAIPSISNWVPVVVNGLPFCLDSDIDGCFVTDASTVSKFFTDPRLTQNVAMEYGGSKLVVRQVLKELYKGDPLPSDFLNMLKNPPQYAIVSAACEEKLFPSFLKDGYFLVSPILVRGEINLATMAKALGLNVDQVKSHQQRIQDELGKLDARLKAEKGKRDVKK